jgi:hypothetical protein
MILASSRLEMILTFPLPLALTGTLMANTLLKSIEHEMLLGFVCSFWHSFLTLSYGSVS